MNIYNKYPILQKYPKMISHTPIYTGGGMIESHFSCDSECPHDIVLGHTSLAQLLVWQDFALKQLFIQQISIPLTATNNVRVLPGHTGIVSLALKLSKTSLVPHHMIIAKGITHVKPLDPTLPLRPVKIEFENNRCCLELCNTSDCTIEFQYGQEITYFDARLKA